MSQSKIKKRIDGTVCPFCGDRVVLPCKRAVEHMIVMKDAKNGHLHYHGPKGEERKEAFDELMDTVWGETGYRPKESKPAEQKVPSEIIFRNRQAIGDILVMTCSIRDFKKQFPETKVGVQTTAAHIWDNNPYVEWVNESPVGVKVEKIGPGWLTNRSNRWDFHHCNSFRMDIERRMGLKIEPGTCRPDIWMTREECERKPLIDGPYWVVIVGGEPGWTAKMWPFERFQEVVDTLPDIKFVQLGMAKHPYEHLKGENVVDYIGKTEDKHTGIRDLFNIFLHAQGSFGLVSMHMHLGAAFNNPCVVIAGAREPASFTLYFGHQYLMTNGCLPCAEDKACWRCDVKGCPDRKGDVPKCVDMITPGDVVRAIMRYYEGGRLKIGKKVKNTFFKNIVEEPKVFQVPKDAPIDESVLKKTGYEWGGVEITEADWQFILQTIRKYKVKSVLQFGSGLVTLLMASEGLDVTVYETEPGRASVVKGVAKDLRMWNGNSDLGTIGPFDMAFVDGPPGGRNREFSTKAGSQFANCVIVHDAGREWETKWQEKYLAGGFDGPFKGGTRCHLWIRKATHRPSEKRKKNTKGLVRLVSTARGWGGAQRSVCLMMKMLSDKGYAVEFVPFHGKYERGKGVCGEFRNNLDPRIEIEDWSSISKPCNTLLVYADDYVWEFGHYEVVDAFEDLRADRKIMFLNYRRGKVGEISWTRGWDLYGGLNTAQMKELMGVYPQAKTFVLPPCTDLTEFFKVRPDFNPPLRLIRHNSQGDVKFDKEETENELESITEARPEVEFHMMPGPSFVDRYNLIKYPKNKPPVPEFLGKGNLFYYSLPRGYGDMGPRVILEAMASGLPIIGDNWGGAVDRVDPACGWLCDEKEEYAKIIKKVTMKELERKGKAARERAREEFVPEKWLEVILG